MDSPVLNLLIFAVLVVMSMVLFWPRVGFVHAIRSRVRMTQRTQLEDALKYIYNRELEDAAATISGLAQGLKVVTETASKLADHMDRVNLIILLDGRVSLTEEGKRYAVQIIRAHRLWERYLADKTGVKPKDWHAQAEEKEHLISPEEADRLSERLGNPRFDPHGDPIPPADGEYLVEKQMSLTELEIGGCASVTHMEDEPEEIYDQLITLGIFLGIELHLISITGKNYIVEAEDRILQITPEAAGNLSIKPIKLIDTVDIKGTQESLIDLKEGETAKVVRISPACRGFERRRLMDLGIIPQTEIRFYENGLTGGLKAFYVKGTVLALRNEQIQMISICDRKGI